MTGGLCSLPCARKAGCIASLSLGFWSPLGEVLPVIWSFTNPKPLLLPFLPHFHPLIAISPFESENLSMDLLHLPLVVKASITFSSLWSHQAMHLLPSLGSLFAFFLHFHSLNDSTKVLVAEHGELAVLFQPCL